MPKSTPQSASQPDPARVVEVLDAIDEAYPDPKQELNFETPFQLLIATALAAQSRDERINKVTPGLFKKYPTPKDFADAPIEELEEDLKLTGFYRQKAKAVKGCCRGLVDDHDGEVPEDLEALVKLPGVGRKTAQMVLGDAFGHAGAVSVDTHVKRLSQRLGFTTETTPEKIERDLIALWPEARRSRTCRALQLHGRRVCTAKAPSCTTCSLRDLCPSAK